MSEVEQLAQEQFNTFKNRLCEILSEIEEEHKSAFMQGYAKGETDEKFRTKQVIKYDYNNEVAKEYTTLREEIAKLEEENTKLKADYKSLYELREEENKDASKKITELKDNLNDISNAENKATEVLSEAKDFIITLKAENKELKKQLEAEQKLNEQIKVRFVKCSSCTEEMKDKCLMFTENLCEGEKCDELIDLVSLINESEVSHKLSKAVELIKELCGMVRELNNPNVQLTNVDFSLSEAEQFLKECE
jgi:small-conductance mechanosensitive channel